MSRPKSDTPYQDLAAKLNVPLCTGGCGIKSSHYQGFIDPFNVIHWRERLFTRRGARHFLVLVAKRERLIDPMFINDKRYGAYYIYRDSVRAQELAGQLGFRIPAKAFDLDRLKARYLARSTYVAPSAYGKMRAWLNR